jgi:hypothetical protein
VEGFFEHGNEPSGPIKCCEDLESRRAQLHEINPTAPGD